MAQRVRGSWLAFAAGCFIVFPLGLAAQSYDSNDKSVDIRSSVGSLHAGSDADPREVGLPVYPGARLKRDDNQDKNSANLALFTSAFGMKLVVINYASDDAPDKIIAFYREKLKKYGKVLECHNSSDDAQVQTSEGDDSRASKELKCDGDNQGDNVELKVGTEDNQHAVGIQPNKSGTGSTFALVYVRVRGKQGDI